MAVDEKLAQRVRNRLGTQEGLAEKRMFGGLAFLLDGNMCVGVHGKELIVRLDPGETISALARPHTRIFDLSGGRPMQGWILVEPAGVKTDAMLAKWVRVGVAFASSLPKKESSSRSTRS